MGGQPLIASGHRAIHRQVGQASEQRTIAIERSLYYCGVVITIIHRVWVRARRAFVLARRVRDVVAVMT